MEKSSKINIKKLQKYYKLKNLIRYNQMTRSCNESVAEHSYYVTLFTHMICDNLKLDSDTTCKAMIYAVSHDLPEIYISDIPHPVKSKNPELSDLVNSLELVVLKEHMPEYHEAYMDGITHKNDLVSTIVDLADILSVIQYANSQLKMGNSYFNDVLLSATDRYDMCKKHICELCNLESFDLFEELEE